MNTYYKVPVIMFHSVGIIDFKWHNNNLTYPFHAFENTLKWLKKNDYKTIFHADLYNYIFNNKKISNKSIILTFDDGYLDNYVFAYPLLKKYGFKGCIFPSIDFIKDGPKRMVYKQGCDINSLEYSGYLHWSELEEMEKSGVFEVQSHATTHTHYFINDNLIGFRNPNDNFYWLTWNENKREKPNLFYENKQLIRLGYPVFENKPSLSSKRFILNEEFASLFVKHVVEHGGEEFFKDNEWDLKLIEFYKKKRKTFRGKIGYYESDKEYEKRIYSELIDSKLLLEKKLNKTVDVLCWPHGSATQVGVEIANKIGYRLNTAGRDILKSRHLITNSPKTKTNRIYRLSPTLYWNGLGGLRSVSLYLEGWQFGLILKIYNSTGIKNIFLRIIYKLLKLKTKWYFEFMKCLKK